jgi:integrase
MKSDPIPQSHPKIRSKWRKVKRVHGLYQYVPSGVYHARVRYGNKLYRESLKTTDLAFAKRKLRDFIGRLERTDPRRGKVSLHTWLKDYYMPTLKGAEGAVQAKWRIVAKIKKTLFGAKTQPMRDLKPSHVEAWLNKQYGKWSESYYNSALTLIRDAFDKAVADHVLMENPAAGLKYLKRKKPIRLTPTFDQFKQIVVDIRSQKFNGHDAELSGDFVEFLGLAGLGQAEAGSITRADVDLDAGRIIVYRHKTDAGFAIPIFPQVRQLVEKLCAGKKPNERLFKISQARVALRNACKRLDLPQFTQRAMRRMFITRAIEKNVDIKVISQWQGHRDGGKLILDTYSHVRPDSFAAHGVTHER